MKEIKTRVVVKNIKRLDRFKNLMERARKTGVRDKNHTDNDETTSPSPVEFAQHRTASSIKTMAQMGIRMRTNSRLIRLIQKKRATPVEDAANPQSSGLPVKKYKKKTDGVMKARKNSVNDSRLSPNADTSNMSTLRFSRRMQPREPVDGKYLLPSGQLPGKQRFVRSRVNARLLHRFRKNSSTSQILIREASSPKSVGKKEIISAVASPSDNVRSNRPKTLTPERLKPRHFKQALSPSAKSKQPGFTIKFKNRKFKALPLFIKTGQRINQFKHHSDARVVRKMNAFKTARRTVQMVMNARRSVQRAQAAARFNLRIIRMVAKATALLVKGLTALLGISSFVIILLCIVMAIAAVISSPFGIFVSGENTDADVKPLSRIVQQMDDEFAARLEEVQQSAGPVDRVEFYYPGSADNTRMDNWMDIIAVFAVKTVMDTEKGMDVATLDTTRIGIIESVFWDMNPIESLVETIEYKETITVEHENGSISEETITSYEYILHITVASRTAEQQADIYSFTSEQIDLMNEMLSVEFRPFMLAILGKEQDIGFTPE
ncbi:hypothetical protein [Marinicrinis lubricantis]|uniref:Uncharacterized protein n=1 Tax=Marinicrinis lubricantis TaxID=2086470 RepID=A0ABW1ISV2_9BACL